MFTVPDEPPENVSLAHATKSSVRISWEAIPSGSRNGILRNYVVTYVAQKGGEAEKTVTVRGTETSATLSGLLPYTFYIVKVSGRTNKGLGPVSDDLTVRTSEDGKCTVIVLNYGGFISSCSSWSSFCWTG